MTMKAGEFITIDARPYRTFESYHIYYPDLNVVDWINTYEIRVLGNLQRINSTRSGQALMKALRNPITIVPLASPLQKTTTATSANSTDSVKAGVLIRDCIDGHPLGDEEYGTGEGAASTIYFTPGSWTKGDAVFTMPTGPAGATPDEALFHELVHAVRNGQGQSDCRPVRDDYHTMEDFFAILLSNIYSSETNRPLRENHTNFSVMSDAVASSFHARYEYEIDRVCKANSDLARRFAAVPSRFNPLREHYMRALGSALVDTASLFVKPGPPVQYSTGASVVLEVGPARVIKRRHLRRK